MDCEKSKRQDFIIYFLLVSVILVLCSILLIWQFPFWFILFVFAFAISLFFLYFLMNIRRSQIRCLHIKFPNITTFLIFFYTFDISFLIFNVIQFRYISYNFYSNIFTTFITIHATIISVLITITAVAIQLNIEKYSFDMIEYFKDLPEVWAIFIIFFLAIFFDILVLTNSICFKFFNLLILFAIFAILSIFPYFWLLLAFIRPENLIQRHTPSTLFDIKTILQMMYIAAKKGEVAVITSGLRVVDDMVNNAEDFGRMIDLDESELVEIVNLLERISSENVCSDETIMKITNIRNLLNTYMRLEPAVGITEGYM